MASAASAAAASAAAAQRAQREILKRFTDADALSPGTAMIYTPTKGWERRMLGFLLRERIIRAAEGDRYWLDLPTHAAWRAKQRKKGRTLLWIAGGASLAWIAAALALG